MRSEIAELRKRLSQEKEAEILQSLTDLTDRKEALDACASVAVTDSNDKITFVDDKFCAISRYSRDELLGHDHRMMNSGYHSKEFMRDMWTTIQRGFVWHGDIRNRAKDGSFYWVDTTIVPFLDPDGKPRKYMAIRTDITARKRAEHDADQFVGIVESSEDAIIGKDLCGIVTSWNAGVEAMFGYRASEIIGQSIRRIIPPERQAEEAGILAKITNAESMRQFETVRMRRDGSAIEVSITISPIKDSEGRIVGASKVARDITEHKRIQEETRLHNKDLESSLVERTTDLRATADLLETEVAGRHGLERDVLEISESEKLRVGQDLHDGICQTLTAIALMAERLQENLVRQKVPAATLAADTKMIVRDLKEAIGEARRLAMGLYPVNIEEHGLTFALEKLAVDTSARFHAQCLFECPEPVAIADSQAATHAYRIAQEATNNAVRHGRAELVTINLSSTNERITLKIEDNGKGLLEDLKPTGMGLKTMSCRAGQLAVQWISFSPRRAALE